MAKGIVRSKWAIERFFCGKLAEKGKRKQDLVAWMTWNGQDETSLIINKLETLNNYRQGIVGTNPV